MKSGFSGNYRARETLVMPASAGGCQESGELSLRQAMTQFHQKMAREASKLSISDAENPVPSANAPSIIGQFSGHWTKND